MRTTHYCFRRSVRILAIIILMSVGLTQKADAQIVSMANERIDSDSLRRAFADRHYYFGLYKDNYFIFGPSVNHTPNKSNTNVKFQISIAQKLTKATLPWGSYLFLFYSQKVFWNVLQNSMPMTDLNFNPGVGLIKPMFSKNRFIGRLKLLLEHESNGRDGVESRSWNKLTFGASIMVDPTLVVSGQVWVPIVDGVENRDIVKYKGFCQTGWEFRSTDRKLSLAVNLTPRTTGWFDANVCVEAAWRWSTESNQYLFCQYYSGYGEGLIDYNRYTSHIRVGIVIKPTLFSEI